MDFRNSYREITFLIEIRSGYSWNFRIFCWWCWILGL